MVFTHQQAYSQRSRQRSQATRTKGDAARTLARPVGHNKDGMEPGEIPANLLRKDSSSSPRRNYGRRDDSRSRGGRR